MKALASDQPISRRIWIPRSSYSPGNRRSVSHAKAPQTARYRTATMTVIASIERTNEASMLPARPSDGRLLAHAKLSLENVGRRRPEEAEADRAMLAARRMMEPMGLDDALHVGGTRDVAMSYSPMDDHIVEAEVYRAVCG